MSYFRRSRDFIATEGGDSAAAEDAVAERLDDLLEKAERRGRFHIDQDELTRTIGPEFGIAENALTGIIDRLDSSGRVTRRSTADGPVLYRAPSNLKRTTRGLLFAVGAFRQDGHAGIPQEMLLSSAEKILHCGDAVLRNGIRALVTEGTLVLEQVGSEILVFSASAHAAEIAMVQRLMDLTSGRRPLQISRVGKIAARAGKNAGVMLNARQMEAVASILQHPISIVTGAPGTGKTTVVRAAVAGIGAISNRPVLLAAPTGKAARRLMEASGRTASTIHRLLGYSPVLDGFKHHRANPLDAGTVILDEASMIDLKLMVDLLSALPNACRLVFVGDPDQLPPVSYGQPFTDMLASGRFPVVRLSRILRQSEGGAIAKACQAIRDGRVPVLPPYSKERELSILEVPDADAAAALADVVKQAVREGSDPFAGLQVLAPMKKRACGVHSLNHMLAPIANPDFDPAGPSCKLLGGIGRVGGKVQQMRNNYEKGVINGDQGRLIAIGDARRQPHIVAAFGALEAAYTAAEAAAELSPAYAITIHRSQGSEWPTVVVCLPLGARRMLTRNLLYTAISRGKLRVVIVGSQKAIERAIATLGCQRFSGVKERLIRCLAPREGPEGS